MGLLIGVGTTTPHFPYTDLWYGIRINLNNSGHCVADGKLERVGNLDLHRSLPIQSRIKRYVANADGSVKYWLGANDSRVKEGGGAAALNATDGIVQLYKPDYWRRLEFDGNYLTDQRAHMRLLPHMEWRCACTQCRWHAHTDGQRR